MANFSAVPQDQSQWDGANGSMNPQAITLHRTYGGWGGDYSVGKYQRIGGHHFLIGKEVGQWAQFYNSNSVAYHCNGSNYVSVGIEVTGVNEDPLTGWQSACLGQIMNWLSATHGIPLSYVDPESGNASVRVNGSGFRGVISHRNVATDDGSSQHTDFISVAEFNRALGGAPAPADDSKKKGTDEVMYEEVKDDGTKQYWLTVAGGLLQIDAVTAYAHLLAGVPMVANVHTLTIIGLGLGAKKVLKAALA